MLAGKIKVTNRFNISSLAISAARGAFVRDGEIL